MSLIASSDITAVATLVLAVGAIVSAIFAFLAFRKQSEEIRVQRMELERAASDRRRAQASQIFIESTVEELGFLAALASGRKSSPLLGRNPARFVATVRNISDLPIYDVGATWPTGTINQEKDDGLVFAIIKPGRSERFTFRGHLLESTYPEVIVFFRDSAGAHWQADDKGHLIEGSPPWEA
jgi:hypothetical protein